MNIGNGPIATAERQLCRLCLGKEEELLDIFGVQQATGQAEPLPVRIQGCLQLDIAQHDSLPKWICKRCLEKIDDFTSFRERCRLNERKLLLGGDVGPGVSLLTADDADGDVHSDDDDDDDEEEEMEMIVIDPSQDYESSNDSLPNEAYGEKSAVTNAHLPIPPITISRQLNQTAEEEDAEGSDAEEGEEEEEEEDEVETKCDTVSGEARNGLPAHTDSGTTPTKVQKTIVYTCKYCDVAFAASSACQLHEMQDHDLLAPYGCIYCEYKTSIRSYLITHIRDTHSLARPYICVQCNKGFMRRSDLKKHTFVHTGIRPYACDQCSKSFSRNTNLKKHMRTHLGLKPHACQLCSRSFANKADLVRHRSYHQGQEAQHSCVRCGTLYTQKDKLYEHERYCMGQTAFSFGLGVPPLVESVKQELPFIGGLGGTPVPIPPQESVPMVEPNPVESHNYYPDPSLPAANNPQTPPSSKIYSCSKCPKRFLSKVSLRAHQSTHPAEEKRIYECPQCKSQFDGKREYEQHLQTHPELKPFACPTCGKRFSRKDKLHRHERTHQQDRNFCCPNCSAKFVRKDAFESHLKIHCNPTVDGALATGLLASMGHVPGVPEMMVPMAPLQQHSLLYSMVREDGTMAIDPSMRM